MIGRPPEAVGEPAHRQRAEHEERAGRGGEEDDHAVADAERVADVGREHAEGRALELLERRSAAAARRRSAVPACRDPLPQRHSARRRRRAAGRPRRAPARLPPLAAPRVPLRRRAPRPRAAPPRCADTSGLSEYSTCRSLPSPLSLPALALRAGSPSHARCSPGSTQSRSYAHGSFYLAVEAFAPTGSVSFTIAFVAGSYRARNTGCANACVFALYAIFPNRVRRPIPPSRRPCRSSRS